METMDLSRRINQDQLDYAPVERQRLAETHNENMYAVKAARQTPEITAWMASEDPLANPAEAINAAIPKRNALLAEQGMPPLSVSGMEPAVGKDGNPTGMWELVYADGTRGGAVPLDEATAVAGRVLGVDWEAGRAKKQRNAYSRGQSGSATPKGREALWARNWMDRGKLAQKALDAADLKFDAAAMMDKKRYEAARRAARIVAAESARRLDHYGRTGQMYVNAADPNTWTESLDDYEPLPGYEEAMAIVEGFLAEESGKGGSAVTPRDDGKGAKGRKKSKVPEVGAKVSPARGMTATVFRPINQGTWAKTADGKYFVFAEDTNEWIPSDPPATITGKKHPDAPTGNRNYGVSREQ
jgi:hypothetical protein